MTFTAWLTNGLPKLLKETEYWKDARVKPLNHFYEITLCTVRITIAEDDAAYFSCQLIIGVELAPIIAEACHIITLIEQKRRELT